MKSNNPRNLHEGHFTAHVGLYPKLNVFMSFYQDAVDKLYREISEGNETADRIAMPLLFLMRHAMELGYKYTISEICRLNRTSYEPQEDGHSFRRLHSKLKKEFDTLWQEGGLIDDKKTGFDEHYALTEKAMVWFDEEDPNGVNFRYPPSEFGIDKKINLLELKNNFDQAMKLLTVTIDVITEACRKTVAFRNFSQTKQP